MPKKYITALRVLFAVSFAAIGLYHELASALMGMVLLIWLIFLKKEQALRYHASVTIVAPFAIYICYVLSCIWAVDSGLAAWGIARYLPLPLMALCLSQTESKERATILQDIPWIGGAMTVVSYVLQFVPLLHDMFSVSDRLSGFFLYPNTFACFLLLGLEVLLLQTEKLRWSEIVCAVVLAFGLLQAGSRTVFVLAIAAILVCLLLKRKKPAYMIAGASVAGGILLMLAANLIARNTATEHMLDISTNASTLLGRLLYWKDALPQIVKHPFGLGYLGYYVTQSSFQTGVYSVRWIHNDALQLLLDIGWVPVIIALVALIKAVISKRVTILQKVVLLTLLAHCMMDFDLEFVAMYFVLLLCLDWEEGKKQTLKFGAIPVALASILTAATLYIGVGSTLNYMDKHEAAVKCYPWDTLSRTELLTQATTAEEMDAQADQILKQNDYVALAWDAKAQAAFSRGDFSTVIQAKQRAMTLNKYATDEYVDYFEKLRVGYELYQQNSDTDSAEICRQEIVDIQNRIDMVLEETDSLAWRIVDQPELTMPQEYYDYLTSISK